MQGIWVQNGKASLRKVSLPVPEPGEALIKVHFAGICATDLHMLRGYYDFSGILGHELVGSILRVEPFNASNKNRIKNLWPRGTRVVADINITCISTGHDLCDRCLSNDITHCEFRSCIGIKDRDGTFCEFITVPISNLHRVPETITDEEAVFTEPLAAALSITESVHIKPTSRVAIIGAGKLGLLISQVISLTGCELTVVAKHELQFSLLKSFKIRACSERAVEDEGKELPFDIVIEATGSSNGLDLARSIVKPKGIIVLKSTYSGSVQLNLSMLVVNEVKLIGSRCGPFQPALKLLDLKLVDVEPLISKIYPLELGLDAIAEASKRGVLKVLIQP